MFGYYSYIGDKTMIVNQVDVNREFHKFYGKIQVCGIEMKAAEILAELDADRYEEAIEAFAEERGYHKWTDGEWYEVIEVSDFSGAGEEDR
jgi:hypothetical protein